MKLKSAHIANFRGIRDVAIDFRSSPGDQPRSLTVLLGDNGSGKTTALQAIALTLSLATRRTKSPGSFAWHGFVPERVSSLGRTRVELTVLFDPDEVDLTASLYNEWYDSQAAEWKQAHRVVPPSAYAEVTVVYDSGKISSPQGQGAIHQFLGRYYIKSLRSQPKHRQQFPRLGDIFWFDQHRNLGTLANGHSEEDAHEPAQRETWEAGVEQLREFLVGWWAYHVSTNKPGGRDYIPALERQFSRLFPGTVFRGIAQREAAPSAKASDFYFLMERDGKLYDIAEMSSGEQAVFPVLYEFVRLDIAKSVVLIDELELHLHPPQQQALLAALPLIGPDCQFIITTHSDYLSQVIPNDQEVRLDGGRRCP